MAAKVFDSLVLERHTQRLRELSRSSQLLGTVGDDGKLTFTASDKWLWSSNALGCLNLERPDSAGAG